MDIKRQKRLITAFYFFVLVLGLLAVRLWVIQVRDGDNYAIMALEQGSSSVVLEDVCRGRILDRNLMPLTGARVGDRVVFFPALIEDKDLVLQVLSETLNTPQQELAGFLYDPSYLPLTLLPEQSKAVKEYDWKGVTVLPVSFRYGDRPLAAQVVGHLGRISSKEELSLLSERSNKLYRFSDLVGKSGLEFFYETELKGGRPERAVRIFYDAEGNLLKGSVFQVEDDVRDKTRRDLVLTIDARIQSIVEEVMDQRVAKGAVVVMEAGTGDLLAMAGRPSYHPAQVEVYLQNGGEERFFDHCTALYPPGSIFKIVVAAAALEEGIARLNSRFTCHGENEQLIHCWKDAGHGSITFAQAFAASCNPVFARLGLSLGDSKIIEYAQRLGLDNQVVTGYPVPPDHRQDLNLINAPNSLVNSSVGQGPVLATPVQVTAMLNAVVSDGIYRLPRLVKELRESNGKVAREFTADPGRKAIQPDTASELRRLLELVIDEGAGSEAMAPLFGSAGKTGSAQVGDSGQVNAWFTGYAPRANPCYIVTVLVEGGASGAESAAPVFREIMEQILSLD
ncbi:MAG: penicillin-binding transpeptidase domain-containing protein [Desulfotomaculaceae bacterium]|nr:penicillin-binding transpeptidase domain-containing protein [Desulfotomaculaceae bacterium]